MVILPTRSNSGWTKLWRKENKFVTWCAFIANTALAILRYPAAFLSPITGTTPTEREEKTLYNEEILFDGSQSFLVWRKRMVIFSIPMQLLSVLPNVRDLIILIINQEQDDWCEYCTHLGKGANISENSAVFLSVLAAMIGTFLWTDYQKSKRVYFLGWALSLLLSLWPMLVPKNSLTDSDKLADSDLKVQIQTYRYTSQFLMILPIYLSLAGGLKSGSARVHKAIPTPMSGTIVLFSAAFSMIMPLAIISLLNQIKIGPEEWGLLIPLSFGSICVGPVLILFNSTAFEEGKGRIVALVGKIFSIAGLVGLLLWLIIFVRYVEAVSEDLVDYIIGDPVLFVLSKIVAFLGNMFYMTVVWTDIIVSATIIQFHWGDAGSVQFLFERGFGDAAIKRQSDKQHGDLSPLLDLH
jgi:hypothetical protein